jgi:hypothetical protein
LAEVVLDAGAVGYLAKPSRFCAAMIIELREDGRWPPAVPSIVLVECLQGHPGRDANTNRFLRTCDIVEEIPEAIARRAAFLRTRARRGSAVDALVVALAEPGGMVLTSDPVDLIALAARADDVRIQRV